MHPFQQPYIPWPDVPVSSADVESSRLPQRTSHRAPNLSVYLPPAGSVPPALQLVAGAQGVLGATVAPATATEDVELELELVVVVVEVVVVEVVVVVGGSTTAAVALELVLELVVVVVDVVVDVVEVVVDVVVVVVEVVVVVIAGTAAPTSAPFTAKSRRVPEAGSMSALTGLVVLK